ncbi:MAG: hypothetical protein QME77_12415, partial [bacterium]|nr:hypothetical protein [bacterium]
LLVPDNTKTAVTREGLPVRCWVWPGNTADASVVAEVKRGLAGWKLGRVITVVDRGCVSEDNLRLLQRAGGHYIAGERLRSGTPAVEAALARPGGQVPNPISPFWDDSPCSMVLAVIQSGRGFRAFGILSRFPVLDGLLACLGHTVGTRPALEPRGGYQPHLVESKTD